MTRAGLRARWPRWPVTLAVLGVIVAGGAAAVAKWPHARWWLIIVFAAAAAVMPPALAAISQASQRGQEMARITRAGLRGTTGRGRGTLPSVRTADLEARVHRSVLPVPYIHRDEEDRIRACLRAKRPVLLIGSSMVGKTKVAARVTVEELGSWPVAIPESKTALTDLDAKDVSLLRSVIWLDDIDRLIGANGITDGSLQRLVGAGNIIIGTIRASAYGRFRPSDQLRPPEWDVLSSFEHIFISRNLSERELERLAGAVDDSGIRDRICAVGLGEYVGAAGQVAEALKLGAAGADGVGYALILGAADWRRCGMTRAVPEAVLAPLAEHHLDQRGRARLRDQETFATGLRWATRDINPNVSLLQPAGPDSYIVYDYALDLISKQGAPVPVANWAVVMANADASELLDIGYTAEVIHHRTETAIQAFRKGAESGHAAEAPAALQSLGVLLRKQGDTDGATAAFQRAIDSGHADAAPRAIRSLGLLLEELGDADGAKAAYRQAIDSGHADQAPQAAVNLGVLLEELGDTDGAKAAYRQAIDSGHADQAPQAAVNLGVLLGMQGDTDGAQAAFQQAIDSGHADQAPQAAYNLGVLLGMQGDTDGAKAAYRQAIDFGHADSAWSATLNLGVLLEEQGDTDGAKAAFRQAIDSGDVGAAPVATANLGDLLEEEGDADGAKAAFQRAIDSGHADQAPRAAVSLGGLLEKQGDADGAKAAYRHAIDSGHADFARRGAFYLGGLLEKQGDADGAKAAYRQVMDFGHADELMSLLDEQVDGDSAEAIYQRAIDIQEAALLLGILLRQQGDADGAEVVRLQGNAAAMIVLLYEGNLGPAKPSPSRRARRRRRRERRTSHGS